MKHVIMDIGGRFFTGNDVEYLQESVRELTELLTQVLTGENSTDPLVLKGVQFVDTGTTITASGGWIYWEGELYKFIPPPAPIAQTGLVNVKLYRTSQSDADLGYEDDPTVVPIQVEKYISLEAASWVDTNIAAGDRIVVADLSYHTTGWLTLKTQGQDLADGSTWFVADYVDAVLQVRRVANMVEIYGAIKSENIASFICQLPVGFRPVRRKRISVDYGHSVYILPDGNMYYDNEAPGGVAVIEFSNVFSID